jgi:DNA-binding NtrC family response regulator
MISLIVIDDDVALCNDPWVIEAKEAYPELNILFYSHSKEALECIQNKISSGDMSIVMLDLDFPGDLYSGEKILKKIRDSSKLIPVIIFSAMKIELAECQNLINMQTESFLKKTDSSAKIVETLGNVISLLKNDVASALEEWIRVHPQEKLDKPYLYTASGKTYTLNNILMEVRKDSEIGREWTKKLLELTIHLVARDKEAL